ncbi:MAG: 30S ribosomal protein S6 [Holosporaceae bacterium]|jgi:small subunit ribosomal protein S6|nr:30S ribosomal protein S6 [Holosporaceae bacterium]
MICAPSGPKNTPPRFWGSDKALGYGRVLPLGFRQSHWQRNNPVIHQKILAMTPQKVYKQAYVDGWVGRRSRMVMDSMNFYECIFIGRQDLSQQQIEALGVSLGVFVTQNSGEVVRSEYCGFRSLAYPIKKNHKGHYYVIQMKASGDAVAELERIMRINDDIIRHLVVRVAAFDDRENLITQMKVFGEDYGPQRDFGFRGEGRSRDRVVPEADVVEVEEQTA